MLRFAVAKLTRLETMEKNKYKYWVDLIKAGKIKISTKCLSMNLACTKEMRAKCDGACCRGHNEVMLPTYADGEKLTKDVEKYIENNRVKFDENGNCKMLPYCIKDGSGRPIECKLAPLGFNKAGRLITKRWAWFRPCPAYGKGEPIYISMKDCLIDVFGEERYKTICWMVENNIENYETNKK